MIIVRPREYSATEKLYAWHIFKAMWVTLGHMLRHVMGALTRRRTLETWEYPEESRRYPQRARLLHRMTRREDGTPKCVACFMCASACPADAIEIIADEPTTPEEQKPPLSFVIDELRCVFCGFCVEVCPKDAIRMDSDIGDLVGSQREEFIYTLDQLLEMPPRPGVYLGDRELDAKKQAGQIPGVQ